MSQEISSCDIKSLRLDAQLAERKLLLHSLLAQKMPPGYADPFVKKAPSAPGQTKRRSLCIAQIWKKLGRSQRKGITG